jgi:hypothetical protein
MTHLEIINKALAYVGESLLDDADGSDDTTTTVLLFYSGAWKALLSHYPWNAFLVEESIEGEEDDEVLGYEFAVPSACLRLFQILDIDYAQAHDVHRRGSKLYSQVYDELILVYTSAENLLPVTDYSDDISISFPEYLAECVSLRLASDITFKLTQSPNLQSQLQNRYLVSLQEAMSNENRGRGGERLWGRRIYVNEYDRLY